MKKKYFKPEMDFIPLLTDIIVTSGKEEPTLQEHETAIDVDGFSDVNGLKVEQ